MSEPTNGDRMKLIVKVEVREYFDHFLEEILPEVITAHNKDVTAHAAQIKGAVRAESYRLRLWLFGLIFAGGIGGGVGLSRAIAALL